MADERRLFDVDHPYYCSDSNYFASGTNQPFTSYSSWEDFLEEEGDADFDMNLVFRWDWKPKLTGQGATRIDDNYRGYTLSIFWMGQRKGLFRVTETDVCRADELAVRTWLAARWQHLQLLWAPFSGVIE